MGALFCLSGCVKNTVCMKASDLLLQSTWGDICLVPVETYKKPTEALYGSVNPLKPIDEPKQLAREYIRKKLVEDYQ